MDAQCSFKAILYFRTRRDVENIENSLLLNELHCQGVTEKNDKTHYSPWGR